MFSVANFLDRAKAKALIDSDYRLAKVIGISHGTMSGYRSGKSMPDERVIDQLCALSGDDPAVIAAQIQGERARTPEGKSMWKMIAARLAGGATSAILSILFVIGLIAAPADSARASGLKDSYNSDFPVYTSYLPALLSVWCFLSVRLRRWPSIFRLCVVASLA